MKISATMLAAVLLAAVGCHRENSTVAPTGQTTVEALPDGPGLHVLFIGNSLTAGNDVPGMVQAMAAAGGVTVLPYDKIIGASNLEDQWQEGSARKLLADHHWDFVVLQQGPSTRPESQVQLRESVMRWSDEAHKHDAKPAVYMIWPFQNQERGFELVSESYRAAATAGNAKILPAGDAWQAALRDDPKLALYNPDQLHPTPAGSYLAALVITHGLTGVRPNQVPSKLTLASGQTVSIPDEQAEKLRKAAEKVIGQPEKSK